MRVAREAGDSAVKRVVVKMVLFRSKLGPYLIRGAAVAGDCSCMYYDHQRTARYLR